MTEGWNWEWDDASEQERLVLEIPDEESVTKNYRVDRWIYRLGWSWNENDGSVFFVSEDNALLYARKMSRRGHRMRVVNLKEVKGD